MHTGAVAGSMAGRLATRLTAWPAMRHARAECGHGTGFAATLRPSRTRQVLHVHGQDDAVVCLTWPVIERLAGTLRHSGAVDVLHGDDWIRLRLDSESDVALAMTLTSLAIHATTECDRHLGLPPCSCRIASSR